MTEATNNFSACDMATAAAHGFRDGVASVRPVPPAAAVAMPDVLAQCPKCPDGQNPDDSYASGWNECLKYLQDLARLIPAPDHLRDAAKMVVPEGCALVPVEPTEAMIDVALKWGTKKSEWEELLAAAPTPEPALPWISVEDRLPDHGEPVQVWCEGSESSGVAWMRFGTWYMPEPQAIGYESITYWAPLLSAPEQPAKEQGHE